MVNGRVLLHFDKGLRVNMYLGIVYLIFTLKKQALHTKYPQIKYHLNDVENEKCVVIYNEDLIIV